MNIALSNLIMPEDIMYYASAKDFCTFKVGGPLEYLICPKTLDSFCNYLQSLDANNIKYKVVGNMSNILPSDNLNSGVYITTRYINEKPKVFNTCVTAYCGYPLSALCYKTAQLGLAGIENLFGIPATVGGAVYNNAGAFGQSISNTLKSLLIYSKGKTTSVSASYANLAYRHSAFQTNGEIVLSATFKLTPQNAQVVLNNLKKVQSLRTETQPNLPSAGSVFKRVENTSAGLLIQQVGLKGKQIGNAQISTKHANFIVNLGGATSADIKTLVTLAHKQVKQKLNINLSREIEYIGDPNEDCSRLSYT